MTGKTLFHSTHSQILSLPEAVAFPATVHDVAIVKDGVRRIPVPADSVWDDFFEGSGIDLAARDQSEAQAHDPF